MTATTQRDPLKAAYESMAARTEAIPELDIATTRDVFDGLARVTAEPEGVSYAEVDAGGVKAIWCVPEECAEDRVLIHTHGGGFMVCSMHSDRKLAGHIAKAVGARVIVLDFRLAPEHPFPAQLDDAVAAYEWVLGQGISPAHVATVGHSAGGNLCTSSVLRLREEGRPLPAAVMPVSPWYDMELQGGSMLTRAETDAIVQRPILEGMLSAFLGETPPTHPLANPLYADLTGFPPTLLHVGDQETLVDDAVRFARRAEQAGVEVEIHIAPEMQHSYPLLAGRDERADATIRRMADWVRPKLGL